MSKGPGRLGIEILAQLGDAPAHAMPWRELKDRFPRQAKTRSFHRSVRSLESQGLIRVDRKRWLVHLNHPRLGPDLVLVKQALDMVATLARARGVPVPKPGDKIPDMPPIRWGTG